VFQGVLGFFKKMNYLKISTFPFSGPKRASHQPGARGKAASLVASSASSGSSCVFFYVSGLSAVDFVFLMKTMTI
jgi:adenosylmethionine-8-amino-7-oxononanoate aminotransferase